MFAAVLADSVSLRKQISDEKTREAEAESEPSTTNGATTARRRKRKPPAVDGDAPSQAPPTLSSEQGVSAEAKAETVALRAQVERLEASFRQLIAAQTNRAPAKGGDGVPAEPVAAAEASRGGTRLRGALRASNIAGMIGQIHLDESRMATNTLTKLMTDKSHGGRAATIFLFLGGLHEFKGRRASRAYLAVWLMALASCGLACWGNLWYQEVPSHNSPTDFLTAYVHIPALQGWAFWRGKLGCPQFHSVVDTLRLAKPEARERFAWRVKWLSRLVLATCVGFTGLVLVAYALPIRLEYSRENADHRAMVDGKPPTFMWWHEVIMWVAIMPVVFVRRHRWTSSISRLSPADRTCPPPTTPLSSLPPPTPSSPTTPTPSLSPLTPSLSSTTHAHVCAERTPAHHSRCSRRTRCSSSSACCTGSTSRPRRSR